MTSTTQASQFLTFALGEEVFAMDITTVREIIQHGPMTQVPLMPGFVRGVINLRGAVVPVIDLHARFGRPPATVGKKTCIVIFDVQRGQERVELGLLVDAVSEVIEIPPGQIEPPPTFGGPVRRDFIRAMGKVDGCFVILLDADRALDVEEMAQACEAAQAGPRLGRSQGGPAPQVTPWPLAGPGGSERSERGGTHDAAA